MSQKLESPIVNRRRGQAVAGIGSNALKAINKGQSRWGHHRRRSGPRPNADSFIRHKELPALVQGAQFDADSQPGESSSNQRPDTLMQDHSPPARQNPLATHGRTIHVGQTETSGRIRARSGLPPTTDMRRLRQHVGLVPIASPKKETASGRPLGNEIRSRTGMPASIVAKIGPAALII
jgi:hypothetical protein